MRATLPVADYQLHYRLRQLLANHEPVTYGDLRRQHEVNPVDLESQLATYPEIFAAGTSAAGRPTIQLKEGELPTREDILTRHQLVKLVKEAGANGIHLRKLYAASGHASQVVALLLAEVPEIEAQGKGSQILYRWVGAALDSRIQDFREPAEPEPEPVGEQSEHAPKTHEIQFLKERDKLAALCQKTHRHLHWLGNFLDPAVVLKLCEAFPELFVAERIDPEVPDSLPDRKVRHINNVTTQN